MNITVRCTTCYPMRLGDCPDTLDFAIAVAANTEYAYELCDSQGNIYEGETTTNGSGNVSISTSDVPFDAYPGLFNKWAGSFKLTLFDSEGDAVPFTVAGVEYTCIAFSFRETVELDNCNNEITCGCLLGGYAFPSDLIGQDGDFYIVQTSGVILEKDNGVWTVFHVPTNSTGTVNGANNGLHLDGTNAQLGVNPLIENTTIIGGTYDYKVTSVPEVGKTAEYEASQDLFGLLALAGFAINGQGFRYVLTYDGNGDPESWLFVKVSNDTALSGTYNASIGYINLATAAECFYEVTTAGLRAVTYDAVANETGLHINRVTEVIDILVHGVTKMTIDSSGITNNGLAGVGDRLMFANVSGLEGVKTAAQATAMLDVMVGDGGAGGTKGLVPPPAAGDAAASKFLKADGTWATAGSSGKLVWVGQMNTRTSANGLGAGIANTVVWASVTIPANTLQAGDIIKIYGAFDSPTSASYTMGISLSSQATYGGTEYAFSGNSASRYLGTENVVFYSGGNLIAPYFNTGWAGGLNIRENAYLGASTNNIISPGKTTAFAATNALYARAQFYGTLGVAYECLFIYVEIIRP